MRRAVVRVAILSSSASPALDPTYERAAAEALRERLGASRWSLGAAWLSMRSGAAQARDDAPRGQVEPGAQDGLRLGRAACDGQVDARVEALAPDLLNHPGRLEVG